MKRDKSSLQTKLVQTKTDQTDASPKETCPEKHMTECLQATARLYHVQCSAIYFLHLSVLCKLHQGVIAQALPNLSPRRHNVTTSLPNDCRVQNLSQWQNDTIQVYDSSLAMKSRSLVLIKILEDFLNLLSTCGPLHILLLLLLRRHRPSFNSFVDVSNFFNSN